MNGIPLTYIAVEELDLLGQSVAASGDPRYWYKILKSDPTAEPRSKHTVYVWPTGTQNRQFIISYQIVPTLMNASVIDDNSFTVPDAFHEDVVKYCIARAHNKNNNLQAEAAQMQIYDRNITLRRDEAQTADVVQYKIGDPDDFYTLSGDL